MFVGLFIVSGVTDISHDDRYFDVADRVIAMDKGIIVNGNGSAFVPK